MEESVYSRPVLLSCFSHILLYIIKYIYSNVYKNFEDKINELIKCIIFVL